MRSRRSSRRGCAPTGRRGRRCRPRRLRGPGRALPALSGRPSERGGEPGCCRGRPRRGPRLALQPGMCPGVSARARRGAGCRAACAALTGRAQGCASRVWRCGLLRTVTVTGDKWLGLCLTMEYLKAALGPSCYLQSAHPGAKAQLWKTELGSVGLLVTIIIIMVAGVLETQKGSLSPGSRSPKELVT